jgi:hypothetical protein
MNFHFLLPSLRLENCEIRLFAILVPSSGFRVVELRTRNSEPGTTRAKAISQESVSALSALAPVEIVT